MVLCTQQISIHCYALWIKFDYSLRPLRDGFFLFLFPSYLSISRRANNAEESNALSFFSNPLRFTKKYLLLMGLIHCEKLQCVQRRSYILSARHNHYKPIYETCLECSSFFCIHILNAIHLNQFLKIIYMEHLLPLHCIAFLIVFIFVYAFNG